DALAAWAESALDRLAGAEPVLPEALSDRQQDVWEPLLAIADLAGADWPKQARRAAAVLHEHEGALEKAEELLRAIRDAFDALNVDKLHTHALIEELAANEEARYHKWWNTKDREQPPPQPRVIHSRKAAS